MGFRLYYRSRTIILTHLIVWFTQLIVLVTWLVIAAIGFYPVERKEKGSEVYLALYNVLTVGVMIARTCMNVTILYMLV